MNDAKRLRVLLRFISLEHDRGRAYIDIDSEEVDLCHWEAYERAVIEGDSRGEKKALRRAIDALAMSHER